jgi:hypothetical protein
MSSGDANLLGSWVSGYVAGSVAGEVILYLDTAWHSSAPAYLFKISSCEFPKLSYKSKIQLSVPLEQHL